MWIAAILAIAGLLVDLVVHVAAMGGLRPQEWVRPDWVGAVLLWGMLGVVVAGTKGIMVFRERRARERGEAMEEPVMPGWMKGIFWAVVAYGVFNMVLLGRVGLGAGNPVRLVDGTYALDPGHYRPMKPITEAEYHAIRSRWVRCATGMVLMFYVSCALDLVWLALGKPGRVREPGKEGRGWTLGLGWTKRVEFRENGGD